MGRAYGKWDAMLEYIMDYKIIGYYANYVGLHKNQHFSTMWPFRMDEAFSRGIIRTWALIKFYMPN